MVKDNKTRFGTALPFLSKRRKRFTTGISAADRATTIQAAVHLEARSEDLVSPGMFFSIIARKGRRSGAPPVRPKVR